MTLFFKFDVNDDVRRMKPFFTSIHLLSLRVDVEILLFLLRNYIKEIQNFCFCRQRRSRPNGNHKRSIKDRLPRSPFRL